MLALRPHVAVAVDSATRAARTELGGEPSDIGGRGPTTRSRFTRSSKSGRSGSAGTRPYATARVARSKHASMSSPTRSALLSDLFFNPIGSTGVLATQVPNAIMVVLAMRHRSAQSIRVSGDIRPRLHGAREASRRRPHGRSARPRVGRRPPPRPSPLTDRPPRSASLSTGPDTPQRRCRRSPATPAPAGRSKRTQRAPQVPFRGTCKGV